MQSLKANQFKTNKTNLEKEKRWLTYRINFHLIYPGSPTLPSQINDCICQYNLFN